MAATTETANSFSRQSHGNSTNPREESSYRGSIRSEALDMCGLEVHRIPSTDIKLVRSLAQGAYGEVWLADYFGRPVAAKRLLTGKNAIHEVQKFIWEIKLVSKYVPTTAAQLTKFVVCLGLNARSLSSLSAWRGQDQSI